MLFRGVLAGEGDGDGRGAIFSKTKLVKRICSPQKQIFNFLPQMFVPSHNGFKSLDILSLAHGYLVKANLRCQEILPGWPSRLASHPGNKRHIYSIICSKRPERQIKKHGIISKF